MSLTELALNETQPGWDEETEEGFDPETRRLVISLPLPPPDNACHYSGASNRYATTPYRDWLSISARRLRALLGPWPADGEEWWGVEVWLWMGSRSDGPNHLKPLLDLLGGSYIPEKGERDPRSGNLLDRQKVQKTDRGLFLNDRRIRWATPHVRQVRCQEPRCVVVAYPVPSPMDEKAEADAIERAARAREKAEEQARRECQRAEAAEAKRVEQERLRLLERTRDSGIVAWLLAEGVTGKIPGAAMELVAPRFGVSEGRVRKVWRAHLEASR